MSTCAECRRRSWLLGALNGRLEYVGRSSIRLAGLLELSDERLIEAVGGSESERLRKTTRDSPRYAWRSRGKCNRSAATIVAFR